MWSRCGPRRADWEKLADDRLTVCPSDRMWICFPSAALIETVVNIRCLYLSCWCLFVLTGIFGRLLRWNFWVVCLSEGTADPYNPLELIHIWNQRRVLTQKKKKERKIGSRGREVLLFSVKNGKYSAGTWRGLSGYAHLVNICSIVVQSKFEVFFKNRETSSLDGMEGRGVG